MNEEIIKLNSIAKNIRKDIIEMIYNAKSGHPGGSLSCTDLLVCLYHYKLNLNVDKNGNRIDKFILSKGHASAAYYAILSSKGFIPHEDLITFRKYDSYLEGHPSNKIVGIDTSSGSLGQGLSIANGMALSKKVFNEEGKVYCLVGDGELEEGQIWEALMTANKYRLNNLTMIIDNNGLQIDGSVNSVKKLENLNEKLESFGFYVQTIDGHDYEDILKALDNVGKKDMPNCIIANTVKGKGISFMENKVEWHGKSLNDEEFKIAIEELK